VPWFALLKVIMNVVAISNIRALRGPNIWTHVTALEFLVEFHLSDHRSLHSDPSAVTRSTGWVMSDVARLRQRVRAAWPAVSATQHATVDLAAETRHPGLALANLFVQTVIDLQCDAGSTVTFGRVQESGQPGCYRVAVEYAEEPVGRQALTAAQSVFATAWSEVVAHADAERTVAQSAPEPAAGRFSLSAMIENCLRELRTLDQQIRLGPSTGAIVRAAAKRGIPARRLNDRSLVQLGYGCEQHRILAAETDRTSAIAEAIVQDKNLTKQLLSAIGAPVPAGRKVTSADDAWEAAVEIGVPVVVKPKDGNQGKGVAVNLQTEEQVRQAYQAAVSRYDEILVEKYAMGADYRLLVINRKLVAAARREPPLVLGDGRRTIAELVAETNRDPRRGEDHATALSKIPLDEIALAVLADQGLSVDSIPAAGQQVLLRRNANLSTGGSATDVTELVHPEVTARVVEAVRMVGLDIAGVDVIAQDISRPLEAQGGVIVEINAAPGLRMHLEPSGGSPRPVGEAIVDMMFPHPGSGRIPIAAVTGVNGKTTTTRLLAHLLRTAGKRTGMTCTDGVYINDRRIDTGDCSGPKSARNVLSNPLVEAAVLETARGGILREGLGFDRADVSVVTNIGEGDHLGMNGIDTIEQLARVKRVIVENVAPTGTAVLNAADPLVAAMADYCPGAVLMFAREAQHPVLVTHRQRGGKVMFVDNQQIVAAEGVWEARVAPLAAVPITMQGLIGFQVENALAAAAAAWSLGLRLETIRQGLESFVNTSAKVPARFNLIQFRGATIVIDYGHNASALEALMDAFEQLQHERRLIVYTAAGDRRDEDIRRQAELIAQGFDSWIMYEDLCTRGRPDGEVLRLMREGIPTTRRLQTVLEAFSEMEAIGKALDLMQPGDLILVQADQVEAAIEFVEAELARRGLESPRDRSPVRSTPSK
jgi:cyanophycin synthetase